MRVWDIPVEKLCNKHLLGQHREIHAIYSMITQNKGGSYQNHPEVIRWKSRLDALRIRHYETKEEMVKRKMNHKSNLPVMVVLGSMHQPDKWQTVEEQVLILRNKKCSCKV